MIINANSIVQNVIQVKIGIIKHVNVKVKVIVHAKKKYSWNPSICTSESSKYLKSFVDTSVIACDEFVSFMDIVSTKERNTITENVSISCYSEKKDIKLIAIFCTKFY